jgi:hypothetical protein
MRHSNAVFGKSYTRDGNMSVAVSPEGEPWYADLQKLTSDELMRMYTVLADGRYRFAKNAWYIPIGGDQRCPIMVAKGYRSPDTLDRMVEFQDTAKALEIEFQSFIDAWDFGYISEPQIERAILRILEERNIAITEHSGSKSP